MKNYSLKTTYKVILLGFVLVNNIWAVESEKNDKMSKSTIHHEPHRPDHRAAINAVMRAQFHIDSAKCAEDRMCRTDNQLHRDLNMANMNAHKINFIKEQNAFNFAMYGKREGLEIQSIKHHTEPNKIHIQSQAQKTDARHRIERQRSALNIESSIETPVPAKQLRIGTKADDIRVKVHSHTQDRDRSAISKAALPVTRSPKVRKSNAKSSLPETKTPDVMTQTPRSSKSRSRQEKVAKVRERHNRVTDKNKKDK